MLEIKRASVVDLPIIAHIHKRSYSRNHYTTLLPDELLIRYYGYFLGSGSEVWIAFEDSSKHIGGERFSESALGFIVFGRGIPEKIAKFKRECRAELALSALRHPWMASTRLIRMVIPKKTHVNLVPTAEFLLLSIAVKEPRRSIGRRLLDAMLENASENGCSAVGLFVNVDNLLAINLYFSTGYRILQHVRGQYYMERSVG